VPTASLTVGLVLIVLSLAFYLATGGASATALIPIAFGLPLALLGLMARRRPEVRKHAMHAAAAIALLGFLGTLRGLLALPRLLGGGVVERPTAVVAQSLVAVSCAVFVVLAVRSFVNARRARTA
jgi:hypothetical protein